MDENPYKAPLTGGAGLRQPSTYLWWISRLLAVLAIAFVIALIVSFVNW